MAGKQISVGTEDIRWSESKKTLGWTIWKIELEIKIE